MLVDLGTRSHAGNALRSMGSVAEKAVIPYVSHKDGFVAREACGVLKDIGTAECLPALNDAAMSKNFFLASGAREAVKSVEARVKK
jgi:HEAT repeat protein